jgi:hypothetical protein
MDIHPDVVVTTREHLREQLAEAEERGRQRGLTEAAGRVSPEIELRLHRLKEALLLCSHAASGSRYAWVGSRYEMPPSSGTSSGDRVNRVGEIVRQTLAADRTDTHRGNESLAFQSANEFYKTHPDIEARSWFGRLTLGKLGVK